MKHVVSVFVLVAVLTLGAGVCNAQPAVMVAQLTVTCPSSGTGMNSGYWWANTTAYPQVALVVLDSSPAFNFTVLDVKSTPFAAGGWYYYFNIQRAHSYSFMIMGNIPPGTYAGQNWGSSLPPGIVQLNSATLGCN